MQKGLFRWKYWNHDLLYIFGCMVIISGLTWSNFLMSLGQFILLGNWILEFNYKKKLSRLCSNKTALIVLSLFAIHLIGLLWTSNFDYALKDLRIKLPLLFLPIVFASAIQFSKKTFDFLIHFFIAVVLITTFVSLYRYLQIRDIALFDKRDLSINISHIRFSLLICLSVFLSLYQFYKYTGGFKLLFLVISIWQIVFLFILESFSGIVILSLLLPVVTIIYSLSIRSNLKRIASSSLIIVFTLSVLSVLIWRISNYHFSPRPEQTQLKVTAIGSPYFQDTTEWANKQLENGYYIYQNIAYWELEDAWNERSNFKYSGKDENGNDLYITLIRFLASKGEAKDRASIERLTTDEVAAIEAGIANVNYLRYPQVARIDKIIWEFDHYSKGLGTNGHSVASRIVYWKQAWKLIKENWIIGVGTGDLQDEFESSYQRTGSELNDSFRLRAHNQYLTFWVTFGIVGLLLILFSFGLPITISFYKADYQHLIFMAIALLSMINEDTLETQAGVTFFAFFNALLLFSRNYTSKIDS